MKRIHHILDAEAARDAELHLSREDSVMRDLIGKHGPCPLYTRRFRPFDTIVRAVIGQQLSARAAETIEGRVALITKRPFVPWRLLAVPAQQLRAAGLSSAKEKHIRTLAEEVVAKRLDFPALVKLPDEDVVTRLTALPGIGRWTAEMFLIFGMKRPDVLAAGDAGLQRAARQLYQTEHTDCLSVVSDSWRPFRSVASWYLWQHLDSR